MKKTKLVLPMLAGILAVSVYVANAKEEHAVKPKAANNQAWTLNNPTDDPTNPANYSPYPGDLSTFCAGTEKVCGIMAPNDGSDHPTIATGSALEQRIENKDTSGSDVFLQN